MTLRQNRKKRRQGKAKHVIRESFWSLLSLEQLGASSLCATARWHQCAPVGFSRSRLASCVKKRRKMWNSIQSSWEKTKKTSQSPPPKVVVYKSSFYETYKLESFTMSKTDCHLLRQKVHQRISVMNTNTLYVSRQLAF